MPDKQPSNKDIARILDRIADLLEAQDANVHRVRAYRNAASRVRNTDDSIAEIVRSGDGDALQKMPDIGEGLAQIVATYVRTGRSDLLDRLQGEVSPEDVFTQVPGIGEELAGRIADQLEIHTLEELEQAAHDGRLEDVEGIGPKRLRSVRMSLAGMLSRAAQRRATQRTEDDEGDARAQPDVGTLLEVDKEYRRKAEAGELKQIAPKRFNPDDEAWLPILHTSRGEWQLTVLYSNTARAHDLGKTHDWVVLYFEKNSHEDQATVVTATHGTLEGKRVVRGREAECERYYEQRSEST